MFGMVGNCSSILLLLIYHMNLEVDHSKGKQEGKHYFLENRGSIGSQSEYLFSEYLEGLRILYSSCCTLTRSTPQCGRVWEVK